MKTYMLFIMLCIPFAGCELPRNVKVTVVEESGEPIEGAEVLIGFVGYTNDKDETGVTDDQGVFEKSGIADLRILVRVNKEGYYETEKDRLSRKLDHDLVLVLRKKINPVSLYAKKHSGALPGIGSPYGFDLERGDWVQPHGTGINTDILFRAIEAQDSNGKWGGRIEMFFAQEDEGVMSVDIDSGYLPRSKMVMPHLAPGEGYQKSYRRIEYGYQNENKERNVSFFIRTRKRMLPDGTEVFQYAKFYTGLSFLMGGGKFVEEKYRGISPKEMARVEFIYAFNPKEGDRNLEFDTKQNLLEGLDTTEKVRQP